MEVSEVLVQLDWDGGTAGVVAHADEPGLWLAHDLSVGGLSRIDGYRAVIMGLENERTLQGGRLPDHAAAAEVLTPAGERVQAAVGRGAYAIIFEGDVHETQPVRFSTAGGAVVRVPWPKGTPIEDALDPCPACDATVWEEVGDSVVCTVCGHAERMGVSLAPVAEGSPPPRRAHPDVPEMPAIDFPVYAVAGRAATWAGGGHGGRPGHVDRRSIRVQHDDGAIVVETSRHDEQVEPAVTRARRALEHAQHDGDWPAVSHPALSIWLDARRREHARLAMTARTGAAHISVDRRPVEFVVVSAPGRWAGCADLDEHNSIVITAVGVEMHGVELTALDRPPERPTWG